MNPLNPANFVKWGLFVGAMAVAAYAGRRVASIVDNTATNAVVGSVEWTREKMRDFRFKRGTNPTVSREYA